MPRSPQHLWRLLSVQWRRKGAKETTEQLQVVQRRIATTVGAVLLGLVALAFAAASDKAQQLFLALAAAHPWAPLIVTPLSFVIVLLATQHWAPEARSSGIPQVIAASRYPDEAATSPLVSMRTAAAKFALTVVALASGGSFGREGPTVQISAAVMVASHRLLRVPISPGVLIAGGAAGVAAAFNTPLAGVAFAIEELAAAYEQRVAILVMGAVMIAGLVSLGIAGDYVYFGVMRQTLTLESVLVIAPVAGIAGGLSGGLFSRIALAAAAPTRPWLQRLKRQPIRYALICGLVVAVLGVVTGGITWGTGYEATRQMVEGEGQPFWFGPAKFFATLASAVVGIPGGVFAPSLSVGAGLGNMLTGLFPDDPPGAIVLLGMIAYFVGVVRSPLTAVIIITETTASRGMILPLFATALIADGVSALVCRERLYHGLARPFLAARHDPGRDEDGPSPPAGNDSRTSA